MALRVTQGMMQTQILRNINNNLLSIDENQNMLSTGRKINKPSDDPIGATYAMRYRSQLNVTDQYVRNISSAKTNLDATDSALESINELLQRAKELTTQGVNGTNPQTALNAIAEELGQIYDQAVNLGNTQINGKYIFNGQMTETPPYTQEDAATQSSDDQHIEIQIYDNTSVPVNVTGVDVFGEPVPATPDYLDDLDNLNGDNMFAVLKGLQKSFEDGQTDTAAKLMDKLTSRMDAILEVRSQVGAVTNRVDLVSSRVEDLNMSFTSMLSSTEDADIAELAVNLQNGQNVYQASLSVGAKLMQKSLVDYLG
ncbi:flagellar hook-associated protein FlgL [Cohnella lubricantis]|uniref:Flagellar hook-associated protein FlgL n=1 Tax=Cohnella lubricantis TaxID=2163172 RepID=A0A841T8Z9_9BACL|nr:flagellar hook-associated protein FlgL [Cohnella lubricantis]MBB6677412.1 flagellar hook-associated protein FlgL [Cohnella lubricantis]MBP2118697.1 flagellar hook-associated protein 3 FlgL [Cohnella lubricantis]